MIPLWPFKYPYPPPPRPIQTFLLRTSTAINNRSSGSLPHGVNFSFLYVTASCFRCYFRKLLSSTHPARVTVEVDWLHRKKRLTSFPSPAGMSLTKLPLDRNNSVMMTSLFPPRNSLVVTSQLGTGNSRIFFYGVMFCVLLVGY